ncbi:LOW QUALITY PROTEIN: major intrinsically disordered Notch2-binding receptor 1 [Centropristis striata]|uniref:LOW QUALITY PROTEIN: major intrinsically disordered Notch2-binding receptor 1 n=1 Tax=Centropristis striata TaxID=184440 RepID=UPI0027E173AB|nr:LOW QUALITY PROTEIN: major intrinsically disordered Notch2-binding receptor 1 [Centropristis striata]
MDPLPDYSLVLVRILDELDTKQSAMSYQDLCKFLCANFNMVQLAKLRSLLFYTACLDPPFPADLFKDKMCCSMQEPQSKKRMVVEDIVTIFNLIQMNRGIAKDKLPILHRAKFHENQSVELCSSLNDDYKFKDCERGLGQEHMDEPRGGHHHHNHQRLQQHSVSQSTAPCSTLSKNDCQQFITIDSNFLLGISKDLKCRAASPDKLHRLPQYSSSSSHSPSCEMQSTKSITETLQYSCYPEPFPVHSFSQKRSIFKEDFHNFSPQVCVHCKKRCKGGSKVYKRMFINHSFELSYSNPYFVYLSNARSSFQDRQRVKHDNLEDLQASTYFGSPTVSDCTSNRKQSNTAGKQLLWSVKSLCISKEEGPTDFDRSLLNSKPLKENHHGNAKIIFTENERHFQNPGEKALASPSGFAKKANGIRNKDLALMASEPAGWEKIETVKRFSGKNMNSISIQGGDSSSSVGTQTEQAEQNKVKDYPAKYSDRERHVFKHFEGDSEILSDDISTMFNFLDDMSVCDSLGVAQSSCYNSHGSLSQVTMKSDGDNYPEHNAVKLAKSKLDRLFHSLENTDDELKSSICKVITRIGEIEKKLESLLGIRSEISQVISKINMLDEKIQETEANGKHEEMVSASWPNDTSDKPLPYHHLHPNTTPSPCVFQGHTTGRNVKMEIATSDESCCSDGGNSDNLRLKPLKMSMSIRRWSHSLNKEKSGTESKVASLTSSLQDWWTVSYPYHCGYEVKDKGRKSKDRHRKAEEAERERQYKLPQAKCLPKPRKESPLSKQFISPHHFTPSIKAHVKGSPLYTNLRFTSLSDGMRGQPSWAIKKYNRISEEKGKQLTALELQTQECLNPNNLEYWMEDIYTPGYDSLLKRKEAESRRAKVWKIGALIAAATCTVILVIVTIYIMKT